MAIYDLPRRSTTGGAQKEVYITSQGSIKPGDILELSGDYTWIKFMNVHGTKESPITLRAKAGSKVTIGSTVYAGIELNGGYINIVGDGITINHPDTQNPQEGIRLNSSHHNEISGVKMNNVKVGIIQNPLGGQVIEGQFFHHLTITNMVNPKAAGRVEAFYLGATSDPDKKGICTFKDCRIEDNVMDNLSGDAIQAGSGNYFILRNTINKYGQANQEWQNAGIEIGGNASAVIEGNKVTNGIGTPIKIMGKGEVIVKNNYIAYNKPTRSNEDIVYVGGKGGLLTVKLEGNVFEGNVPGRKMVYNNNTVAGTNGGIIATDNKGLKETDIQKLGTVDKFVAFVEPVVVPPVVIAPVIVQPTKKVTKVITVYDDGSVELK